MSLRLATTSVRSQPFDKGKPLYVYEGTIAAVASSKLKRNG